MAKPTNITGLEIEPAAVHAATVSVNGSLRIEHAAVAELEPGVVRDGEVQDVEGLAEALRVLFADHRDLDKRVRLGVANQKIVVRVIELPPIKDPKELEAAVRFQAQDAIAMPLDSAVLDWHALDVVPTDAGPRQRVLVVAARRDMVDKVLAAARAAGLRPEGIDVSAFAMVRALHRASDAQGQAVLYLSISGLTNLAVAEGTTCLFTRVVGGGLEAIAVELAERRAMPLDAARALLHRVGLESTVLEEDEAAVDARAILQDGVARIGGEVRNSLDFHAAQDGSALTVAHAVITGAAAAVPGFAEALGTQLGMPVRRAEIDGSPEGMDPGVLAVAAGLAVDEAPADTNGGRR
ncbi:MAG TPA: pilus assembly protein PilM [Baekduia sp.]|nr:pilus assembly protein PilM [Baekduia sp.]